ncbi:MAG: hypothetical protein ACLTLQ_15635 [[Clostridium] scindens]
MSRICTAIFLICVKKIAQECTVRLAVLLLRLDTGPGRGHTIGGVIGYLTEEMLKGPVQAYKLFVL